MDSPANVPTPRGRGGRGRGRGRGGGGNRAKGRGGGRQPSQDTPGEASSGRPPGSFGARLTEAASNTKGEAATTTTTTKSEEKPPEAVDDADDAEVCFICASPIEHTAIMPCNHQTCHICALRLRALYKTHNCAHCRTEAPFVIFTDSPEKHFQDFRDSDFVNTDDNLGIKYDKDVIREDTLLLLRYNCPDKECDVACYGWPDLYRHVKSKHGKVMCDLCTRNKKVFTHEHELFSFGELRRHEKYGDDNPGAVDQSGFKGHPECGFCRQRFYGDDELYHHCREKHERCHICDRRNGGARPEYYLNYQELEKHFADAHFVCLDAECQANKTNVFESEMDLKAHQLSEHPNSLSKDARRDVALINLSGFDVRTPYQPERSRRGGNGRGRDPNAEPIPTSSAQPLSRAELAYQRQMAIQSSSQSLTPRTFGGQLTPAPQSSAPPQSSARQPQQQQQQQQPQPQQQQQQHQTDISTDLANAARSSSPRSQARLARHTAVSNRASNLVRHDAAKLSRFRSLVSSYRSSGISAAALLDGFFALFDCPSTELGILIRELADLFEDADADAKRTGLLKAWNDWRSINETYPSLPSNSGTSTTSNSSSSAGRRVLKLKSSTQQSAQSRTARHSSWGGGGGGVVATNGGPSSVPAEAFPSLPPGTSSSSSSRRPAAAVSNISWKPSQASASSSSSAAAFPSLSTATAAAAQRPRPAPPPQRPVAPHNDLSFPSLPAAPKPDVSISGFNTRPLGALALRVNGGGGSARSSGTSTPVNGGGSSSSSNANPWAAGTATAASTAASAGADDATTTAKGKGKKKAKGEILFHFG